jgi:gluconate kinase
MEIVRFFMPASLLDSQFTVLKKPGAMSSRSPSMWEPFTDEIVSPAVSCLA